MNKTDALARLRQLVALGVPYVHQGRDLNGIDCIGAWTYAFQYEGEVPAYPENPVNGELERNLRRVLGEPVLERPESAELLCPLDLLSMQYAGPVRHLAVVVPHISIPRALSIVHTDSRLGRVTEHILDGRWLRRVVRVWRP